MVLPPKYVKNAFSVLVNVNLVLWEGEKTVADRWWVCPARSYELPPAKLMIYSINRAGPREEGGRLTLIHFGFQRREHLLKRRPRLRRAKCLLGKVRKIIGITSSTSNTHCVLHSPQRQSQCLPKKGQKYMTSRTKIKQIIHVWKT